MAIPNSSLPEPAGNSGGYFEIGSFDFHGEPVFILSNEHGNWAVLGQLCQNLTLDANGQRQAIERKSWSQGRTCVTHVQLPGDPQQRPHFLIHERIVAMWLANITSSRIADPTVRENIELAQVEFADALHEYVSKRSAIRREPSKLEVARDLVAALEAKEALEAANKVLAPKASKWDRFVNAEGLIGMTAIADMLDLPVKDFTNWLVDIGVFRKQLSRFGSNQNMPRRTYQKSGFFMVKVESNGRVSYEVAYATPEGADFIVDEWDKRSAA
ncbi:phage antirepressor KilAC domain-containing protein [Streptomyces sp. NPDC007148]|uniref:phage antirepressor KilAC domain-containing protein n=1 Tax=Streptomyces sp. NPDC007148 TaxID=3364775 RepID=UPI00369E17D4